jgi:hypothetical protein
MVILKFALVFFLLYLLWLLAMFERMHQPKYGPYYYVDMSATNVNSLQQQFQISYQTAMTAKHALQVECYNNGMPYEITSLTNGVPGTSTFYFVDGYNRLRYVGTQYIRDGLIRMRRLSPVPQD